jgi:hypothetical protein
MNNCPLPPDKLWHQGHEPHAMTNDSLSDSSLGEGLLHELDSRRQYVNVFSVPQAILYHS